MIKKSQSKEGRKGYQTKYKLRVIGKSQIYDVLINLIKSFELVKPKAAVQECYIPKSTLLEALISLSWLIDYLK